MHNDVFSRNSQLQPLTIVVVSFFTHKYFNYNVQSNGFISERFVLKFWFVLINCTLRGVHSWCAKADAPVYKRGVKNMCILGRQLSFFSTFISCSRCRYRSYLVFSIWNFRFHCDAMDLIHNFETQTQQIAYGRVAIFMWFPFKLTGHRRRCRSSLFVVRAILFHVLIATYRSNLLKRWLYMAFHGYKILQMFSTLINRLVFSFLIHSFRFADRKQNCRCSLKCWRF